MKDPWRELGDAKAKLRVEILKVIEPTCSVILNWVITLINRDKGFMHKK